MSQVCFTRNARHRSQFGIGMIEVLIAVLVVSIGFLGMAALQAKALSTNNSAMARSMATVASYSILDAMRADRTSAEAGNYDGTVTANACPAVVAGNLSTVQLNNWCTALGAALGTVASTTGTILCSNAGNCTITIQFDDSRGVASAASTSSVGSSTQKVITEAVL